MSLLLASLFSPTADSTGLMIYDLARSEARYMQILDLSDIPLHLHRLRGISLCMDRLYALAPCALLVFRIVAQQKGPIFQLEKTVCLPEWVLGRRQQADLHAVYASQERKRVYVSFNAQCAIDVFDLDGNFLHRRYLWDLAPDLFPQPATSIRADFQYGVVKHIFDSDADGLLLTAAKLNGTTDSAIIGYENGHVMLYQRETSLHGGIIDKDRFYLCAIQNGEIQSFPVHQGEAPEDRLPLARLVPRLTNEKWFGSEQNTRGMTIIDDKLICGVCHFGKPKPNQVPPRMVEFDLHDVRQIREHWLPSFEGMEEPHIYGLLPITGEINTALADKSEPTFFRGCEPFVPVWTTVDRIDEAAAKMPDADLIREPKTVDDRPSDTDLSETPPLDGDRPDVFPHHRQSDEEGKAKSPGSTSNEPPCVETTHSSLSVHKEAKVSPVIGEPTIIFTDVGLCFARSGRKFLSFNRSLRSKKIFWALQDVSFTVFEGETLGVIGRNGSGKSTLSMLCGGVLLPDHGDVTIMGKTQLLALGVGFRVELSGRENVFISASLLGLRKKEIESKMDDIEAFAELGEYIDEPVRTYSSGMRSRLGFAVATAVKPDILILDEIMATGDKAFRDKAMERMSAMRQLARSIIIVSHNPDQLRELSTKILWLEKGRVIMLDEPEKVLYNYDQFCKNPDKWFADQPQATIGRPVTINYDR